MTELPNTCLTCMHFEMVGVIPIFLGLECKLIREGKPDRCGLTGDGILVMKRCSHTCDKHEYELDKIKMI